MKILVAPDSFKGSLRATQVCQIVHKTLLALDPTIRVDLLPLADGGEGFLEALTGALSLVSKSYAVKGPMGQPVTATLGFSADGQQAFVEMASASGLMLVREPERNPLHATSYGTGELLRHALDAGVTSIILGIGGSATNDGGAGMLQALGFQLLDAGGQVLPVGAEALQRLHHIDRSRVHPRLAAVSITVASDVVNPLLGETGATAVFGPQKGATAVMLPVLEQALTRLADSVEELVGQPYRQREGAGAAGGLGFSLLSLIGASLRSGFDLIAETVHLREKLQTERYDWIITGEGRIDAQSQQGKLLSRLGQLGLDTRTPILAFAGSLGADFQSLPGIEHVFPIVQSPCSLAEAMHDAEALLSAAVHRVMKFLLFCTTR